jgi:L-ascorbate metabolism protein UlaG (beta-lactamase superfamily)
MKLTKFGHACVFIEHNGKKLVIDPGAFTELPEDICGVVAVVYTHMHGDHVDSGNLDLLVKANKDLTIYAEAETMAELAGIDCNKVAIDKTQTIAPGEFEITLYFLDHAVIWKNSPCKNLAVKVNDFYYYPGDTFHIIEEPVQIAGVPVSAPWLKLTDAIQFVHDVRAQKVMPTHNGLMNDAGHMVAHNVLSNFTKDSGKELVLLQNNETYEV